MDYRIIPERLPDDVKTEYLLRDMPISEVIQISREALRKVDYGTLNTYKIELWVRDEYDKQGNIDYLKHIINRGKLWYSDILKAFKLYNPFFELDPSRPIDWLDTMMRERNKKEDVFLTDDFEYVPKSNKPVKISNPRWEHKNEEKAENTPDIAENNDCILLKANLENYTENAPVHFDIYDISKQPPKRIASVNGKNIRNVGTGEWVVSFKHEPLPELEFDASASSKTTLRCPIAIKGLIKVDYAVFGEKTFLHNSALPIPDTDYVFMNTMIMVYKFAQANPDKYCTLFGHASEAGAVDFNYTIAKNRAVLLHALFINNSEIWKTIGAETGKVTDYQRILKNLTKRYGWNCDPGIADGINGPKTQAAIKNFQATYNQKFNTEIDVDGIIGPQTWEALFCAIYSIVKECVLDALGCTELPLLTFEDTPVYSCGKSFTDGESAVMADGIRRVTVGFYLPEEAHPIQEHIDTSSPVELSECPYYDPLKTVWRYIGVHSKGRILVVLNEAGTTVLPYYEFLLYEGTEWRLYAESDSNGEFVLPDNIGDTFDVQVIGPGKQHPLWKQIEVFDGELPLDEIVPVEQCIDEDEDTLSED